MKKTILLTVLLSVVVLISLVFLRGCYEFSQNLFKPPVGKEDPSATLVSAAREGDKETVIKLIKAGVNVNPKDSISGTALLWALKNKDKEMLSILLQAGADPKNPRYNQTFDSLSREGNKEIINMLLEKSVDPTSFLIGACVRNDKVFLTRLLELGADPNGPKGGWTCLMQASDRSNVDTVKELLKWKADPNLASDIFKTTSLHLALGGRESGVTEITKMLLEAGANPNVKDVDGVTPLILAANDSPEVIEALIKAGADVNAADNAGWTTLMWTVSDKNKASISLLLEAGANPNLVRNNGKSALSMARESGDKDIINMLIKAGAKDSAN
jgi:ankyrin repeat protein